MTDRQHWNAARLASQRPLPKARKLHGPVGQYRAVSTGHIQALTREDDCRWHGVGNDRKCNGCGYHVCSCKPKEAPKPERTPITGFSWGFGPNSEVTEQDCGCLLMAYTALSKRNQWLREQCPDADGATTMLLRKGWESMIENYAMRLPCAKHKQPALPMSNYLRARNMYGCVPLPEEPTLRDAPARTKCLLCDGYDTHECPGGTTGGLSISKGLLDARALPGLVNNDPFALPIRVGSSDITFREEATPVGVEAILKQTGTLFGIDQGVPRVDITAKTHVYVRGGQAFLINPDDYEALLEYGK